MRMGFGIFQEQNQRLMMTPELRLAIKILQYSAAELAEYILQEVAENPVLDIKEELPEERVDLDQSNSEDKYDIDWQDYFADTSDLGYSRSKADAEDFQYEQLISKAPSLQEHLSFQLSMIELSPAEKRVVEYLIGNIDDAGYLQVTLEEASRQFAIFLEEAEKALRVVQGLEPYGVGARNLTECLIIQAEALGLESDLLKQVIEGYLPELAKGKISKIAQELQVEPAEIQEAFDIIKKLDPKPGRNFTSATDIRYIVPDIIIERIEGEYVVIVNDTAFPRLVINNAYKEYLKYKEDDDTRKFVEQKLNSAMWLVKSIEQRRLTLYKVAQCLAELQKDFLDYGVRYLKPLNLKQVASRIGVHESTVSRATANKFAQTPQGVFELKYFFTSGVAKETGGMVSAESIKKSIMDLVQKEDSANPFSDQKICDLLNEQGIKISRRTVAKYRGELRVPSASVRKRYE